MTTTAQQTMSFVQQHDDAAPAAQEQTTVQLKARAHAAGHRHGKAFGNVGVVTVEYSSGFAKGFMSAFKD